MCNPSRTVIIDYKAGNLTSVKLAFAALACETQITSDAETILSASRIVFPGVGAAGAAMQHLQELDLIGPLRQAAAKGIPFLGICLGTQILFDVSEEDGETPTLGLLPGRVPRFTPTDRWDKVPQIGWNQVHIQQSHPLLENIADQSDFYFVHSYYPAPTDQALVIGTTTYAGVTFASMVGQANVVATQFHPEKSGRVGLRLLENFTRWNP